MSERSGSDIDQVAPWRQASAHIRFADIGKEGLLGNKADARLDPKLH